MRLIIGSESIISKALQKNWDKKNINYNLTTRRKYSIKKKYSYLDLSKLDNINLSLSKNYSTVLVCASCTDLHRCEVDPEGTYKINVEAVKRIIKFFDSPKTQIILFSSNQVFDGKKPFRKIDSERNPITEYGRQKKKIEDFALNFSNVSILRLTKVFTFDDPLFKGWKENLLKGQKIEAFGDYNISPLPINILVNKVESIINERACGIFHIHGGFPDIPYFDFAVSVANDLQCNKNLIFKSSYRDAEIKYKLQKFTSLSEN